MATLGAMSSVVFFRAVNVGGHQKFQPGKLAKELAEFDVVNIVVEKHLGVPATTRNWNTIEAICEVLEKQS